MLLNVTSSFSTLKNKVIKTIKYHSYQFIIKLTYRHNYNLWKLSELQQSRGSTVLGQCSWLVSQQRYRRIRSAFLRSIVRRVWSQVLLNSLSNNRTWNHSVLLLCASKQSQNLAPRIPSTSPDLCLWINATQKSIEAKFIWVDHGHGADTSWIWCKDDVKDRQTDAPFYRRGPLAPPQASGPSDRQAVSKEPAKSTPSPQEE